MVLACCIFFRSASILLATKVLKQLRHSHYLLERQSSIPRHRVKSEDDNAISTIHPSPSRFLDQIS